MKNNKLVWGGIIIFVGSFTLLGLKNRGGNPPPIVPGRHRPVSAAPADRLPDFSLYQLAGGTIGLSEYRGKKPVVVDFWASWCPNCRRDMPNLDRFYEKYKDKVEVIGVNLGEKESTVRDFVQARGISFPIAFDPSGQAANVFGIRYTNTHFLIDKEGNLVRTIPGDIREADILSLIE